MNNLDCWRSCQQAGKFQVRISLEQITNYKSKLEFYTLNVLLGFWKWKLLELGICESIVRKFGVMMSLEQG